MKNNYNMPQITHRQLERYPIYLFSSDGSIYSLRYKKKMKPAKDKKGYLRTMLTDKYGDSKTVKVHRLIAEAFIFNPENKPQVNHINGIKSDNRVENLEWVTAKENTKHAIEKGLFVFQTPEKSVNKTIKKGSLNGQSKLTELQVIEIRDKFIPRKYTRKMLSKEYGVAEATIKDIVLRKSWKHV
jgi:hypothetical protein